MESSISSFRLSTLTQGDSKQDSKEDISTRRVAIGRKMFPPGGFWDYQYAGAVQLHKHRCAVPLKVPGIPLGLLLPFQAALSCKSCVVSACHIYLKCQRLFQMTLDTSFNNLIPPSTRSVLTDPFGFPYHLLEID